MVVECLLTLVKLAAVVRVLQDKEMQVVMVQHIVDKTGEELVVVVPVSYTHLTLPTILRV